MYVCMHACTIVAKEKKMLQNGLYNAVSWAVTLTHQEKNIHQQGIYNNYSPK